MQDLSEFIGKTYGRLTILREEAPKIYKYKYTHYHQRVLCKCECGNTVVVGISSLRRGKVKSCGCYNIEINIKIHTKHGLSYSAEYDIWQKMKNRCYNPKDKRYEDYGGRGIIMYEGWLGKEGFVQFYSDMGSRPTKKHSIERVDNNKGYFPENCKWATQTEQTRNQRTNVNITYNGKTQCLSAWAEELGISFAKLRHRIQDAKWPIEVAFTRDPNDRSKYRKSQGGEKNPGSKITNKEALEIYNSNSPRKELAEKYNIGRTSVDNIKNGVTWNSVTNHKNNKL